MTVAPPAAENPVNSGVKGPPRGNFPRPARVIYRRKLPLGVSTINQTANRRVYYPDDGEERAGGNEIACLPANEERQVIEEKLKQEQSRPVPSRLPPVRKSVCPALPCSRIVRIRKIYHVPCGLCRKKAVIASKKRSVVYCR